MVPLATTRAQWSTSFAGHSSTVALELSGREDDSSVRGRVAATALADEASRRHLVGIMLPPCSYRRYARRGDSRHALLSALRSAWGFTLVVCCHAVLCNAMKRWLEGPLPLHKVPAKSWDAVAPLGVAAARPLPLHKVPARSWDAAAPLGVAAAPGVAPLGVAAAPGLCARGARPKKRDTTHAPKGTCLLPRGGFWQRLLVARPGLGITLRLMVACCLKVCDNSAA
ncbi:hypothetical protein T492DRAFT_978815 [Pavlovales sp. CCMP2436]|nr:hypothetical protein T492DRAFT_978815 [Pavlovales sp. CCMP2436]